MKRRRWWFIGLGLALLAACVGVWKWEERPPYRFMKGAKLYFVDVHDTHRATRLYYVTEEVTKDGGYRLIQSKVVTTGKLATLQWALPMYE